MLKCYQMPKFLLNDQYHSLCGTSKIIYSIIYSYFLRTLELVEGGEDIKFRDDRGFFVTVDVEKLSALLGLYIKTVYIRLLDLEKFGLIHRVHLGGYTRVYIIHAEDK